MKRTLLVMLAVVMSTAMFAQQEKPLDKGQLVFTNSLMRTVQKPEIISGKSYAEKKGMARSAETGLYYYKPAGSMYETEYVISAQGIGYYYNTILAVPAWQDYTFENMSSNPASTYWFIDDINYNQTYPAMIDESGNLTLYTYPGGYGYLNPVLQTITGTDSYVMGTYGDNSMYAGWSEASYVMQYLGFIDNKDDYTGFSDGTYISGSQSFSYNGSTWTTSELVQTYPAPASTLYAEDLRVKVVTNSTLLKNGKEITMNIYTNNGKSIEDDDYELGELKETLTATIDDFEEAFTSNGTTVGFLHFSKKVDDSIFGTMEEPITIDYPMTIYIEDIDDPDVDLGICGYVLYDCDDQTGISDIRFTGYNDEETRLFSYNDVGMGMNIMFNGIMDKIIVQSELVYGDGYDGDGYNILKISDDGKTCNTYGVDENSYYNLKAAFVETVRAWYDEDGNENYYFDEIAQTTDEDNEWITNIIADTSDYSYEDGYFANYVSFEAEPLPEGMTGRSAVIYLKGSGCTADTPIIIIQGDAEVPEGIETVTASSAKKSAGTYSITGQRVSDKAKGIVIRDGKKYLNK